jgi:O-antigen/teichoic acid export membrane protein
MVLLNLLVKPLAIFGVDANVQNAVGSNEYGIYFSLLNFTYLFNILLDFGITNFNIKYIAQYPHLAKNYIGKIIPLRLFLFLLYCIITLGIAVIFDYNSYQFKLVFLLIVYQFLISVILFLRSYFSGLLMFKTDIILSVLDKFLLILIMFYLLFYQHEIKITILNFIQVQILTLALSCIIAFIFILTKIGIPKIKWNSKFSLLIVKKSFPYALLIVLMMLYNRVDSVMLERILDKDSLETGIYAQAFRLLDAFFMFASLFSTLLFPIFSKMLRKNENVIALLHSSTNVLISFALILITICFFNAEYLMNLIYKQDVESSSQVFKYLIICFLPLSITLIFGTLLTANGNLRFLNTISVIGIVVNIFFNWILIPEQGALGASLTSLITQGIVALIYIIYTFKTFKIAFNLAECIKYLGFIVLIIVTGVILNHYFTNILQIIILISISLIYLLLTNMLQWRLVLNYMKSRN